MATHIFRVTVRGRFDGLDDGQRSELQALADEHSYLQARFTPEGTLTWDGAVDFFSYRVEVRVSAGGDGAPPADLAFGQARSRLVDLLTEWGVGWRDLKVTGSDMADTWR